MLKKNLKIFGIPRLKTLSDFVTSEQDVKKGNNRLPLNLSRLHEEDLIKEDDKKALNKAIENMAIDDADEFSKNIQHKRDAMARASSYIMTDENDDFNQSRERSVSLFQREKEVYNFEDYKIVNLIGRGTFGKVYLVRNEKTGSLHAMKSIRKDVVLQNDSLESLKVEKLILL